LKLKPSRGSTDAMDDIKATNETDVSPDEAPANPSGKGDFLPRIRSRLVGKNRALRSSDDLDALSRRKRYGSSIPLEIEIVTIHDDQEAADDISVSSLGSAFETNHRQRRERQNYSPSPVVELVRPSSPFSIRTCASDAAVPEPVDMESLYVVESPTSCNSSSSSVDEQFCAFVCCSALYPGQGDEEDKEVSGQKGLGVPPPNSPRSLTEERQESSPSSIWTPLFATPRRTWSQQTEAFELRQDDEDDGIVVIPTRGANEYDYDDISGRGARWMAACGRF